MPHYTKAQIEAANACDIAAFLHARGEPLVRRGKQLLWEKHQVWIDGCRWYSHYEAVGGYAISFVVRYFEMTFQAAIEALNGGNLPCHSIAALPPKTEKRLTLPPLNANMNRVYAYLMEQRGIDREVISHFAHQKMLYEDAIHHNCVFIGFDDDGIPHHCHRRSTVGKFKLTEAGSQAEYAFHHDGNSEWLFVFEAPIDMLAFLTLHRENWRAHSYVALCSVSERALLHRLKVNPKLTKIVLCLDNDHAGRAATARITASLHELGYTDVRVHFPKNKDWDDDLRAGRGSE